MRTKARKIPGIMFASFLSLLFLVWLGSFIDFKGSFEKLVPLLEFNGQKALASETDIEEALAIIYLFDDTMYVENDSAFPGEEVWITIGIENDVSIAGFTGGIYYDTSILEPWYLADIDTNFIWDSTCTAWVGDSCTGWELYIDSTIIDTAYGILMDTTERTGPVFVWGEAWWTAGVYNKHLDTATFLTYVGVGNPLLPPGRDPVARIKFVVKPDAPEGGQTDISWVTTLGDDNLPNNWVDDQDNTYIPRTRKGTFTVRSGGVQNNCPVFDAPTQSNFEVNEGAILEFYVTATDPDGDNLTLSMNPLAGYTITFRETSGVGSVTQTFTFKPDYDDGPATIFPTFKAKDEYGCSTMTTVSIQIIETEQDLIIVSSDQGGVPGSSERMVPFIITNTIPIYGFQFTLKWDYTKVDIDSFARTDVIQGYSMYTNLGDSLGVATVLVFGLASQTIPAGIETVLYAAFSVEEDAPPGKVPLQLENAREAVNPGDPSQPLGMVHGLFTIDMFGDANIDTLVDIADVVSVVAYILGHIGFTQRQFMAADVTENDTVNVADLVGIINIILGKWTGPPSFSPYSDSEPPAIVRLDYEDLQPGVTGEVKVLAELEVPVAGAQIEINYDPEQLSFEAPRLSDWSDKFIAQYKDDKQGKLTALLYNLSNDPILPGEGSILSLPVTVSPNVLGKIKLEMGEVVLADENAVEIPVDDGKALVPQAFELSQNYPNPFNPTTTIKYTLPSVGDGQQSLPTTLKIYNILGEVVRTLVDEPKSPGVHYEVWDGKDSQGNQVASGIYFYRLKAGEFSETKKMVMLK